MKLKYIFTSLAAVCLFAIGCTKTYPTELSQVKLSKTSVTFPASHADSVYVVVDAVDSFFIDTATIPDWLVVAPVKGGAGKTEVLFATKDSTVASNSATLKLYCAGATQYIFVQQGNGTPINTPETAFSPDLLIKEFNKYKGLDVYVKGVVKSSSIDLGYGNAEFYLEATEGTFELYRCLDFDAAKFTDSKKVQVGDVVVAYGKLKQYNTTIELDQGCYLVELTKSLIKLLEPSNEFTVDAEEGTLSIRLTKSGNTLDFASNANWLSVESTQTLPGKQDPTFGTFDADTTVVNLHVLANEGGSRTGNFSITSAKDGQSSTIELTVSQMGGNINIEDLAVGDPAHVVGQVTAICSRGFILTDETASVLYYDAGYSGGFNIGDKVEIKCSKVTAFNKGIQLEVANCSMVEKLEEGTYTYPAPVIMTAEHVDQCIASTDDNLASYVSLTGELSISGADGKYQNIIVDGTSNQGSVYQITPEMKATLVSGKTYEFKGYLVSVSSGKYVNILLTEATEASVYKKVSAVTSGKSYLIVFADTLALNALPLNKTYGYPTASSCKAVNGKIKGDFSACEYLFTSVEGGFNIKDSSNRFVYLYKDGAKSMNVAESIPATPVNCGLWNVSFDADGIATIKNLMDNSWVQYSTSYNSAGSYKTEQTGALMPTLYEKQ